MNNWLDICNKSTKLLAATIENSTIFEIRIAGDRQSRYNQENVINLILPQTGTNRHHVFCPKSTENQSRYLKTGGGHLGLPSNSKHNPGHGPPRETRRISVSFEGGSRATRAADQLQKSHVSTLCVSSYSRHALLLQNY